MFGFQRSPYFVPLLSSHRTSVLNKWNESLAWHYYSLFTLSVLRLGKFSRQHFSISPQKLPWKTFCWIVSGMFSQRKDKSRCWMMNSEPTTDACSNEWCSHFFAILTGTSFVRKVYFKDRWVSLRCFDVYVMLLLEPEAGKWDKKYT